MAQVLQRDANGWYWQAVGAGVIPASPAVVLAPGECQIVVTQDANGVTTTSKVCAHPDPCRKPGRPGCDGGKGCGCGCSGERRRPNDQGGPSGPRPTGNDGWPF